VAETAEVMERVPEDGCSNGEDPVPPGLMLGQSRGGEEV